jgi:hypothetical protein
LRERIQPFAARNLDFQLGVKASLGITLNMEVYGLIIRQSGANCSYRNLRRNPFAPRAKDENHPGDSDLNFF